MDEDDDPDIAEARRVLGDDYHVTVWRGGRNRRVFVDDLLAGETLATLYLTPTLYRNAGAWDVRRSLLKPHHVEADIRRFCEQLADRFDVLNLSTSTE
jgi:hypothetical protein